MYTKDHVKLIGHKKGFLLLEHISEFVPRDDYLVIKTPSNPKYISANYVLFQNKPNTQDIERWPDVFKKEFSDIKNINHIKLCWDSSELDSKTQQAFESEGYELEAYETLELKDLKTPSSLNPDLEIKELDYKREWSQVVAQQIELKPDGVPSAHYKAFAEGLMHDYKQLIEKNRCRWFGAYLDQELLGSLGVLWSHMHAGYQRVITNTLHRRKGVCTTLVFNCAQIIEQELKNRLTLMWSEPNSQAGRIYRNCGFEQVDTMLAFRKVLNP